MRQSNDPGRARKVRTLFLSDIHLGFKHARVLELCEFLRGIDAERIVLAGDIVDALSLSKRFFWSADHTNVVRTLLARQRAGVRLVYIPGNHDASLAMLAEMLQGHSSCPPARDRRHALLQHRDWVESCSALVERMDGELQLLRWPYGRALRQRSDASLVADAA
jgi:metallophosphoesterase superfamily enzyme